MPILAPSTTTLCKLPDSVILNTYTGKPLSRHNENAVLSIIFKPRLRASVKVRESKRFKKNITAIEKAIQKSDLGINPANDGVMIRLVFPPLTEDRRKELVKQAKKMTEEAKVSMRNIRREAMDSLKKVDGAPEDEVKKAQDEIQKMLDKNIDELGKVFAAKEKEIMEV